MTCSCPFVLWVGKSCVLIPLHWICCQHLEGGPPNSCIHATRAARSSYFAVVESFLRNGILLNCAHCNYLTARWRFNRLYRVLLTRAGLDVGLKWVMERL